MNQTSIIIREPFYIMWEKITIKGSKRDILEFHVALVVVDLVYALVIHSLWICLLLKPKCLIMKLVNLTMSYLVYYRPLQSSLANNTQHYFPFWAHNGRMIIAWGFSFANACINAFRLLLMHCSSVFARLETSLLVTSS